MSTWDAEDLADLRWHYSGAYVINGSGSRWTARRTDDGQVLTASSALALLGAIRDDYAARPVLRPDVGRITRKFGG